MNDVTGRRLYQLQLGRCPECGCEVWQPGPKGGASQNFECTLCKRRYNVTILGKTVWCAQEIDHHGDWAYYRRHLGVGPLLPKVN